MPLQLQIDLWREVCRHEWLDESVAVIAALVERLIPLRTLLVRQLEPDDPATVRTVAASSPGGPARPFDHARHELPPEAAAAANRFADRGASVWRLTGAPAAGWLDRLVPEELAGCPLWVAGLRTSKGVRGLLILEFAPEATAAPDPDRDEILDALIEPFAAALENDLRLRELTALQQAAEADRLALLHKLGRNEVAGAVVGADRGLRAVFDRVRSAAPSQVPVLILGETGSGKEVVARAIHDGSPRAAGPFLRVNCGAIPPEMIDSELFGHQKGSFTGAIADRRGWFEQADGGTLFLDEVGELAPAAQVRLLRVVQEGVLMRVGSEKPLHVDVRIVSATHRDLPTLIQQGQFRQDLWYRLSVFPIILPPLREHLEDLPDLARHFAERAAVRLGLPLQLPTQADLALLAQYPWPGNIRELQSVIERAAILGGGGGLDIPHALGAPITWPSATSAPAPPGPGTGVAPLDSAMAAHIHQALAQTRGRIDGPRGAACLLGLHPNTLRARMTKLGIRWQDYRD
ncbi:MAG: sigma-54-dependent Fis family transcriptional regulator [Candidatus Sumerlaeia bacterium]|nr:sigma-54-dependent Fis family transcriptional regulator [Candidatus Sumerlaeia bacterium]